MPPLKPVEHVLRVRFAGLLSSVSPWNVILHWNYSGGTPTSPNLVSLCQTFGTAWLTHMAPVHHTTVLLNTVEAVDLSDPAAAFGSALLSHNGSLSIGSPLPAQVAAVCSWKVNYRWRGGHPRSYWPAGSTNSTSNGRFWTQTATDNFDAACNGFLAAMNSASVSSITGRLCCVRRYATLVAGQPPTVLDTPLVLDIVSLDVDSRIDTQRRRLGPDVSS